MQLHGQEHTISQSFVCRLFEDICAGVPTTKPPGFLKLKSCLFKPSMARMHCNFTPDRSVLAPPNRSYTTPDSQHKEPLRALHTLAHAH